MQLLDTPKSPVSQVDQNSPIRISLEKILPNVLLKSVFCGCDIFRSCYSPTRGLVSCPDPAPSFHALVSCAPRRLPPSKPSMQCSYRAQFFEISSTTWKWYDLEVIQFGSNTIWKWYNLELRSSTIWKCALPQSASIATPRPVLWMLIPILHGQSLAGT